MLDESIADVLEAVESQEVITRKATPLEVARLPYQVGLVVVVLDPSGDYDDRAAGFLEEIRVTDDPSCNKTLLALVRNLINGCSHVFPYVSLATLKRTAH